MIIIFKTSKNCYPDTNPNKLFCKNNTIVVNLQYALRRTDTKVDFDYGSHNQNEYSTFMNGLRSKCNQICDIEDIKALDDDGNTSVGAGGVQIGKVNVEILQYSKFLIKGAGVDNTFYNKENKLTLWQNP